MKRMMGGGVAGLAASAVCVGSLFACSGSTSDDQGAAGSAGSSGSDSSIHGTPGQSCIGMTGTECEGKSCCDNIQVSGGTFPMGRCGDTYDPTACTDGYQNSTMDISKEIPEHNAKVASFYLDTYEVTVGRFRRFVEAYDGTPPASAAGAHPLIAGSGWDTSWNPSLPPDHAKLIEHTSCDKKYQTWTDTAGSGESYPINCVNWYTAFAFCVWDGGRLPTEAEWEYAAAGGNDNRLYPWGSDNPDTNKTLANAGYSDLSPLVAVTSHPAGASRWGHEGLAGSLSEWTLDWEDVSWYSGGGNQCDNCANLNAHYFRVHRGGDFLSLASTLRAAYRASFEPESGTDYIGFRCARDQNTK